MEGLGSILKLTKILFSSKPLKGAFILFVFASSWCSTTASGTVYISDHFDNQDDWVGKSGTCNKPPPPWDDYGYYCSDRIKINSNGAHGGRGKGMYIEWGQAMKEWALMTPFSVPAGKQTLWVGFWFRHNKGWNWGGDMTYKWFYGPSAGGDRWMINYQSRHAVIVGDTRLDSNISFDINDDKWHSVIIKMKHNTPNNYDGELRMWWDGVEVKWTIKYGTMRSNTALMFNANGSTWDNNFLAFGFQSRPDWGPGNVSYFDDIIVASTRAEVEAFLNVPALPALPTPPKNLRIAP